MTNISSPLLSGLQQHSDQVLWTLDSKLQSLVRAAQQVLPPSLWDAHSKEMSQAYLQRVDDSIKFLREQGVSGTARHAVSTLIKKLEDAHKLGSHSQADTLPLVSSVGDAWSKLASLPPVHRFLETAQPSVDFAQRKYLDAHDIVVASAIYGRSLEAAAEVLQRVQESPFYKVAAERLYPAISGIADPALEKITNSAYTRAVVQHLKPIHRESVEKDWSISSCVTC